MYFQRQCNPLGRLRKKHTYCLKCMYFSYVSQFKIIYHKQIVKQTPRLTTHNCAKSKCILKQKWLCHTEVQNMEAICHKFACIPFMSLVGQGQGSNQGLAAPTAGTQPINVPPCLQQEPYWGKMEIGKKNQNLYQHCAASVFCTCGIFDKTSC